MSSRTVIVTGAAGGMGSAIAECLQAAGWHVAGFDRRESASATGSWTVDVTDHRAVEAAVTDVEGELGPIVALVSGAGHYESTAFTEVSDDAARTMLRVHLGGFFTTARAVIPGMMARGDGRVVAIASELAIGGGPRDSHYAAAKGAVLGAVRSLAAELAGSGVTVNAVAPGPTNTPMLPADSPWRDPTYLNTLPTRALAEPADVAASVAFLLDSNGFITGETLNPNSGAVI